MTVTWRLHNVQQQVTTELLCEMNPDVKGEYVQDDPDSQMNKGTYSMVCMGWDGMA